MSGKFYGELDPADPKNALITDIQFAPGNARGKVDYVGTFSLMKPIDLSKASGVLMYSVVNRGNGTAAASPEGHISLVSGWQGDVVPTAINQTIQVPRAKNPDGTSITGPLVIRLSSCERYRSSRDGRGSPLASRSAFVLANGMKPPLLPHTCPFERPRCGHVPPGIGAERRHLQRRLDAVKFSRDGKFITSWGQKGSGRGEFGGLHAIAMDSKGRLFVGDRGNSRIQIFDNVELLRWRQLRRRQRVGRRRRRHSLEQELLRTVAWRHFCRVQIAFRIDRD